MTDYFALLNEPRRPWLDPAELKRRFLALTTESHPDRVHEGTRVDQERAHAQTSELNAAFQCLNDTKCRLAHLFELETGAKPGSIQNVAPGMIEQLFELNQLVRAVDKFLLEKSQITSPLLKVQQFEKAMEWTDRFKPHQEQLQARLGELEKELKNLNDAWAAAPHVGDPARGAALPLARLEQIFRDWSYFSRWQQQLQEKVVQLAF